MSATRQPGDAGRIIEQHERRIADLERMLANALAVPNIVVPFNLPDLVEVSESVPWKSLFGAQSIILLCALLGEAGTGPTDIEVRVNGVTRAELTIQAGQTEANLAVWIKLGPTDIVTVAVVATSGDAEDLDVLVGFR